jgi:phosphoadenosine phosphosulfate reductase
VPDVQFPNRVRGPHAPHDPGVSRRTSTFPGYRVWFTALRREQSPTRANLQVFENFRLPQGKVLSKISPLAGWKNSDVWKYLRKYSIPVLPLYDIGYTSIGCQPCTIRPADPENLRSGRWAGKQKLECGIHISTGVGN